MTPKFVTNLVGDVLRLMGPKGSGQVQHNRHTNSPAPVEGHQQKEDPEVSRSLLDYYG